MPSDLPKLPVIVREGADPKYRVPDEHEATQRCWCSKFKGFAF